MKDDKMDKFGFLIGTWDLEYRVPRSIYSEPATGTGTGTFKRALNDKYVYFDYSCTLTTGEGEAHAVFAWDGKAGVYRYWWFENSGNFMRATCNFVSENILFLHWHDSLLNFPRFKNIKNLVYRFK